MQYVFRTENYLDNHCVKVCYVLPHLHKALNDWFNKELMAYNRAGEERLGLQGEIRTRERIRHGVWQTWRKEQVLGWKEMSQATWQNVD